MNLGFYIKSIAPINDSIVGNLTLDAINITFGLSMFLSIYKPQYTLSIPYFSVTSLKDLPASFNVVPAVDLISTNAVLAVDKSV